MLSGALMRTATGAAISALAMLALGAALALQTYARQAPLTEAPQLGGRAQAAHRRYRNLAFASAATVYIAIIAGTLMTDTGALRDCLTLPICPTPTDLAWLSMGHRVLAAVATLLIVLLASQTWRNRLEPTMRYAAVGALVLMLIQNAVGMSQIVFVQNESEFALTTARLAHLMIGAATWGTLVVLATLALRPAWGQGSGVRGQGSGPGAQDATRTTHHATFKDYVSLTKPGVISLLILTTLAAMFITPAGAPSLELIFWTMLGGWMMPAGAHALNCYFDRDIDLKMGRTGRRPLPSNRIPAWHALVLGVSLAVVAFAILAVFVNLVTALLALAGFFYYVVIYTLWLKRNSPSNIVIGGGAGAIPPLVGWAAVTGNLTLAPLLLFAIIFYWTPPHFWALALIRQKDYANAGVPMLPVVAGDDETKRQIVLYTLQMVVLSLLLTPLQMMGVPYLVMAVALGAIFTYYAVQLWRKGTTGSAWGLYKFSLLYLALLFVAMVLDRTVLV
jgi:protoheme IX farnesyltransferase